MLDRFSGPVSNVEELDSVYGRLSPEDKAKVVESLNVVRDRVVRGEQGRVNVSGLFGSFAEIAHGEVRLSLALLPGILTVTIGQQEQEALWQWLNGNA